MPQAVEQLGGGALATHWCLQAEARRTGSEGLVARDAGAVVREGSLVRALEKQVEVVRHQHLNHGITQELKALQCQGSEPDLGKMDPELDGSQLDGSQLDGSEQRQLACGDQWGGAGGREACGRAWGEREGS